MTTAVPSAPASGSDGVLELLRRHVAPGSTVAVGDGAGMPSTLFEALLERAAEAAGIRLLLGWCLALPDGFDPGRFADVRTFMSGGALRGVRGVGYVPVRLAALPSLLEGPWRPDVLLASGRKGSGGPVFGSEVSWMARAAEVAGTVLVEERSRLPSGSGGRPVPGDPIVACRTARPWIEVPAPSPGEVELEVGRRVAALVPTGSVLQYGPGGIGEATLRALSAPVAMASGVITDAVVDLDERGLLQGEPRSAYAVGTERLAGWIDGRGVLDRVEVTHDPSRLASLTFCAVNTALKLDELAQVDVEHGDDGSVVAGVGGHADFAHAAATSPTGLSIVALPSVRRGRSTLVPALGGPTSTARSDVDVVVTERGAVDLRGCTDAERRRAVRSLWA